VRSDGAIGRVAYEFLRAKGFAGVANDSKIDRNCAFSSILTISARFNCDLPKDLASDNWTEAAADRASGGSTRGAKRSIGCPVAAELFCVE
jgi:hypothetical protein